MLTPMPISNNLHAPLCPQDPPATRDFLLFVTYTSVDIFPSFTHFFQRCPQGPGVFTLKYLVLEVEGSG
jgi:hypothetical protein